ncbi:MAG: hypothetical protein ABI333_23010 [bacterium]
MGSTRITQTQLLGCATALMLTLGACGDINMRDGVSAGSSYCQDRSGQFHFKALVPPWKYNKEYRCTSMQSRQCVGTWQPTGRYVFVVSDIPFVNYDSEIVASLAVEVISGNTAQNAQNVIIDKQIGQAGSDASFYGDEVYPRVVEAVSEGGLTGHEVLWRQNRSYEGQSYNWYRRDVFLLGAGGRVFHVEMFSIDFLDKPEFDAILGSFREGVSPDGAPDCACQDEHDPSGPQDC